MNSKCKTCPLWSDEGCQHNEPCPILDDASDARNVDYVSELEAERDKLRAALDGLIIALEGYFGKTRETFFDDADCDSGELYFAAEYNAAQEALKGGE